MNDDKILQQWVVVQKQRSRNYRGINYFKYRVTIPVQIAEMMKLKGGEILEVSLVKKELVIRRILDGQKAQTRKICSFLPPHIIYSVHSFLF
ncbi:MAG: AbrB/MazE/SpoVT family DNA-binding domain-containing protein [Thaumarchaeota archaeon]|nr:AbrB/MazE/SpoVT family DNA-binding domain-containing protein [Nitrososphaerota archaeon]